MSDKPVHRNDLSGKVELPDGEAVTIPRPDNVFPKFAQIDASVDVFVEQDRIRMREEGSCLLEVGAANRTIDDPTPFATLYAGISEGDEEIYSEIALDTADEVRELRDALSVLLRYRGEDDE